MSTGLLNLFLFVPLGFSLRVLGRSAWWSASLGFMLSVLIEGSQLWIPGRDSTFSDVVFNSLGSLVGAMLPLWSRQMAALGARSPTHASLWAGATSAAVLLFTGILLTPSYLGDGYWGEWMQDFDWADGRVISVSLGTTPLGRGPLSEPERISSLLATEAPLAIHAVAGSRFDQRVPIFDLADLNERVVFALSFQGADLVFWQRTRATDLRFLSPRNPLGRHRRHRGPRDPNRLGYKVDRQGTLL